MFNISRNKISAASMLLCISFFQLQAASVGSDPIGVVKTTLPAGTNLYTASFVNPLAHVGGFDGISVNTGQTTLTAANLVNAAYDAGAAYPTHYIEITEDTDGTDGLDTEGLMFDIVSNDANTILVDADLLANGVNGDETFVIRPHMTLAKLFSESTGFSDYLDTMTLYKSDGTSEVYIYTASNWLADDFLTSADEAIVYPGEGIAVNTLQTVNIVHSGNVKMGPTQIPLYGNSVVNIFGFIYPIPIDLEASGLEISMTPFYETLTIYDQTGLLGNDVYLFDPHSQLLDSFFMVLPGTVMVESDNPVVGIFVADKYNKIPAVVIGQ